MDWIRGVQRLREQREAGVLVTVTEVTGHAPREAGAKMVVSETQTWGSIGGGNLEAVAVHRARSLIDTMMTGPVAPRTFTSDLSDRAPAEHGVQCCGGRVSVLLEPLGVRPAVAIFGGGHVGMELARILARHDRHENHGRRERRKQRQQTGRRRVAVGPQGCVRWRSGWCMDWRGRRRWRRSRRAAPHGGPRRDGRRRSWGRGF